MKYKNVNLPEFRHLRIVKLNEELGFISFTCENKETFVLDVDTLTVRFHGFNQIKPEALGELVSTIEALKVNNLETRFSHVCSLDRLDLS